MIYIFLNNFFFKKKYKGRPCRAGPSRARAQALERRPFKGQGRPFKGLGPGTALEGAQVLELRPFKGLGPGTALEGPGPRHGPGPHGPGPGPGLGLSFSSQARPRHGPALCRAVPGTVQARHGPGVKRAVPARHGTFDTTTSYLFHYVSKIQGIGFRVSESVPSKSKDINP